MKALRFKVDGRTGYAKAVLLPANHSEETHFGWLDRMVIAFFLLSLVGLILLLAR